MGAIRRNETTWWDTDTRLRHNVFFRENINSRISTHDSGGGGALKGILEYLEMASGCAANGNIQELKGLMGRQPIGRKDGTMVGRILRQLLYGVHKCPNPKLKLGE